MLVYNGNAYMNRHNESELEEKPMKLKRVFAISAVLPALIALAFSFSGSKADDVSKVSAASELRLPDFGSEEEASDELSVTVTSASKTAYSTAYNIKFSTGGDAFADTNNMCNVLGNTDELINFYNNEFNPLTQEEKTKWRQEVAAGERSTLVYEGYVHSFKMNNSEVFVPRHLSRGTFEYDAVFTVNITSIASNAFTDNARVTDLYIPEDIQNIPADAFTKAPDLARIHLEHTTVPAGFETGWNAGAEILLGEDIYSGHSKYENASTISTVVVGDPDINYILGYFPENKAATPLTLEYEVDKAGVKETRYFEFEKVDKHNIYDAVGKGIAGFTNTLVFNIEHASDETVEYDSLKIHNIFKAKAEMVEGRQVWSPDSEAQYAVAHKAFEEEFNLDDFIKIQFKNITTFNGYTSINTNVDIVNNGLIYKKLKANFYKDYESRIKSGAARIRFRITGLSNAKYHVFYGNTDKVVNVQTPVSQFILNSYKNNNLTITFKDSDIASGFNSNGLKAFSLNNASISVDIVLNNVIMTKTAAVTSFGSIYLLRYQNLNTFNLNTFFLIFSIGYVVAAALLSAFLFFYFKRKYRNDEFRRLKPKQFIKKCVIYSLTSLMVVLAILFVVMRLTAFNNAVVVYNPLDVFIIINGIATVIIIGYYIKNLVGFVKANNQRKKALKLGLMNDKADDGTK